MQTKGKFWNNLLKSGNQMGCGYLMKILKCGQKTNIAHPECETNFVFHILK